MSDSESPKSPSKRASTIRKGTIVGGIVGFLFTLVIQLLAYECARTPGENGFGIVLMFPWFAVVVPTATICQLFGWNWETGASFGGVTLAMLGLMLLTNTILWGIAGAIIGLLAKLSRGDMNKTSG